MDDVTRMPRNANVVAEIEVPSPEIDRSIYVMPAFATLRVRDLEAARRWYVEGLGFIVLAELPGPAGEIALIHLRRWRYQDILLVPARDPDSPAPSGIRLTFCAHGTDLDALAAQARATDGGVVEGPFATPWNTRDVVAHILAAARPAGPRILQPHGAGATAHARGGRGCPRGHKPRTLARG
jgi:catechol 2,3-dioxygenase-like lactoylglutathione lyase family enzyme